MHSGTKCLCSLKSCNIYFRRVYSLLFSYYGIPFQQSICTSTYCAGAGKITLMSIPHELGLYIFRWKMEKTRPMREEMDGKVFISRHIRYVCFAKNMVKALFSFCTSIWRVDIYVSGQERGKNRRTEIIITDILFSTVGINTFLSVNCKRLELFNRLKASLLSFSKLV